MSFGFFRGCVAVVAGAGLVMMLNTITMNSALRSGDFQYLDCRSNHYLSSGAPCMEASFSTDASMAVGESAHPRLRRVLEVTGTEPFITTNTPSHTANVDQTDNLIVQDNISLGNNNNNNSNDNDTDSSINNLPPPQPFSLIQQPRSLPSFYGGKGGVIVFLHVAKNGGTSIRRLFQRHRSALVQKRAKFEESMPLMKQWAMGKGDKDKLLVVELHDGNALSLGEMSVSLKNLRREAQEHGVPFFVLSTVRSPLAYAISFFNFEHIGPGGKRHGKANNGTESEFLRLMRPNLQCLFFARGELSTTEQYRDLAHNVTSEECNYKTYQVMTQTIDWVGTVESLDTETLPMLAYMLNVDNDKVDDGSKALEVLGKMDKHANHAPTKLVHLKKEHLSKEALQHIDNIMRGDAGIYRQVQRDYRPERLFTNWDPKITTTTTANDKTVAPIQNDKQDNGKAKRKGRAVITPTTNDKTAAPIQNDKKDNGKAKRKGRVMNRRRRRQQQNLRR